jgi:hypothetical protein
LTGSGEWQSRDRERRASGKVEGWVQNRPGSDLWTLQVLKNADVPPDRGGNRPDELEGCPMLLVIAVRKVQPRHVHPGIDQRPYPLGGVRRGAEGANDFRPAAKLLHRLNLL